MPNLSHFFNSFWLKLYHLLAKNQWNIKPFMSVYLFMNLQKNIEKFPKKYYKSTKKRPQEVLSLTTLLSSFQNLSLLFILVYKFQIIQTLFKARQIEVFQLKPNINLTSQYLLIKNQQRMYNKEFLKYEKLKGELEMIKNLCANQYFSVEKCKGEKDCGKKHVDRCFYPCIHYYMGNCKYGFSCHFSHALRRQINRPEPSKQTCKKLYYENYCPAGSKCRFSHDLREYPCVYNSISKCKFSDADCRYSHQKKLEVPIVCFFNLMGGCTNNQNCQNAHNIDNVIKYISYDGPL